LVSKRPPEKLVVMGRIAAPFGIKGWIKVQPFTAAPENLLAYGAWWIGRDGQWREYRVSGAEVRGRTLVAKVEGCDDRDAALLFRNRQVAVGRDVLPRTAANEYYWADLIGLAVVGDTGQDLGRVVRILETGANNVLVVRGEGERLIPFIADAIRQVDLVAGVIRVDWGADY
jgi:16S rRNA processing protein RimM